MVKIHILTRRAAPGSASTKATAEAWPLGLYSSQTKLKQRKRRRHRQPRPALPSTTWAATTRNIQQLPRDSLWLLYPPTHATPWTLALRFASQTTPASSQRRDEQEEALSPPSPPVVVAIEDNANGLDSSKIDPLPPPLSTFSSSSTLWNGWWEQLQSPPNLITMGRILSAPYLSYLIVTQQHEAALLGCFLSAVSDVADGALARAYPRMATVLGTYLDPFADKLVINVVAVSLWYASGNSTTMAATTAVGDVGAGPMTMLQLPGPLVALWCLRDAGLMMATYLYVARQTKVGQPVMDPANVPFKVMPSLLSKCNTGLQFVTLGVGLLSPIYPMPHAMNTLCWLTAVTTLSSTVHYIRYSAFSEVIISVVQETKKDDTTHPEERK